MQIIEKMRCRGLPRQITSLKLFDEFAKSSQIRSQS